MKNNHMKIDTFKKKDKKEVTKAVINLPKKKIPEKAENKQGVTDGRKLLPQLFKKGQSGNPAGRPKGLLNWRNTIKEAAMKEIEFIEKSTGKKVTKTLNQIIAEKLVEKARQGDIQAIKEYGDRTDGKAHQSINLEGDLSVTQRLIILPAKKDKK